VRVGSIAGGGRYDELVGMFSGRKVPAVGGSIGIERIFVLIEDKLKQTLRSVDTQVFICSVAQNFTKERLALAAELWAEGIAVEFAYKEKPDAKAQFGQAAACGAKIAVTIAPEGSQTEQSN
jgi:histidyl-tRNA synthetase